MIPINELRVNNWVNLEFVGPMQWEYTHFEEFVKFDNKTAIISDKIEPIALTPELLEKAGFDIDLDNFNWNAYKEFENNGFSYYVSLRFNKTKQFWFYHHAASSIKSLHQLQNLYLDLANTELEINL